MQMTQGAHSEPLIIRVRAIMDVLGGGGRHCRDGGIRGGGLRARMPGSQPGEQLCHQSFVSTHLQCVSHIFTKRLSQL